MDRRDASLHQDATASRDDAHPPPKHPISKSDLDPPSSSAALRLGWLALGLALFLLYGRTVFFPFVSWDDPDHIYRNAAILTPEALPASERWFPKHLGYPMPLTIASYRWDRFWVERLEKRAFQGLVSPLAPPLLSQGWVSHGTNLALFACLALLVALIVRLLFPPAVAMVLFAFVSFHPLWVESVAWISGRKDLLVALGVLGTFFSTLRALRGSILWWLPALGFGGIAFASKPVAVCLLAIVGGLLLFPPSQIRPSSGLLRFRLWGGGLWLIFAGASAWIIQISFVWQAKTGALQGASAWSERLTLAIGGLGVHLRRVVAPFDLAIVYPEPPMLGSFAFVLGLLACVATLLGLWACLFRGFHLLGIGLLVFWGAWLPSSGIIPLTRYLADTYMLLPLVGLALLFGLLLTHLQTTLPSRRWRRVQIALGVGILGLAATSASLLERWSSSERLWLPLVERHPHNPRICRSLGFAYNETGQIQKAVETYRICAAKFGIDWVAHNLAISLFLAGKLEEASTLFLSILDRTPHDPRALRYLTLIRAAETRPSPPPPR